MSKRVKKKRRNEEKSPSLNILNVTKE